VIRLKDRPKTLGITEDQLNHTFQVARDTLERLKITRIVAGSQAEALGLRAGDIVLSYNGKLLAAQEDLTKAKEGVTGDAVEMVILRNGEESTLRLKPGQVGIFTEPDYY
jgi:S1-C subfamily serine protease